MEGIEIEKALEDLETRIERLRALYEQYFMGIEKLEPQIPRKEIDRRITIFRKEQIRNTAQRFKFQTLIQRYNTMQQYWGRVTREIENGTYRRDVLKAAARFGETEALTMLGKKKAKQFAKLIAAQAERQAQASGREREREREEETYELDVEDLVEDEVVVDDPISAQSSARTPAPQSGSSAGLRWGGGPAKPSAIAGPPASTGSSADPRSDVRYADAQSGVKRRVAELAAAMKAAKVQDDPGGGFGALDLDFEDASGGRGAPAPTAKGARGTPASAPPAARHIAPVAPIFAPRAAPAQGTPAVRPAIGAPAGGSTRPAPPGFGALDLPFDEDEAPTPASRQRLPAAGPVKPAPGKAPAVSFGALDLDFDAAAKVPAAEPPSHRRPAGPTSPAARPGPQTPARATPAPPAVQAPPPQRPVPAGPGASARPGMIPGAATHPFARPEAPQRLAAVTPPPQAAPRAAPPAASVPPRPVTAPAAPPGGDGGLPDQRIRQLYSKYVDAKRAANESTAGVTYEKLAETLRAQANKLRSAHPAKQVDYEVVMKDGRPHLKPILR
ncbi:MAG: MXAN_5187 C-terminal domain-containing protein [Minicystis sp.]